MALPEQASMEEPGHDSLTSWAKHIRGFSQVLGCMPDYPTHTLKTHTRGGGVRDQALLAGGGGVVVTM